MIGNKIIIQLKRFVWIGIALLGLQPVQASESYSFGVLSQRSPVLNARYWNPILDYVGRKAGVSLLLSVARTAPESNTAIQTGKYDFTYSNHLFRPSNLSQHYRVVLQPRKEAIRGQIVTLENSPVHSLTDLKGKEVGFPSPAAFVGYAVPMDHLLREGVRVMAAFGGNQEGIMGQLRAGRVIAAAVNSQVMRSYAARTGLHYRVLWESEPYNNLPIAVHPRVSEAVAKAVQQAFAGMSEDPQGLRILETSAALIRERPPLGFRAATLDDYMNYVEFYRHTVVKELRQP